MSMLTVPNYGRTDLPTFGNRGIGKRERKKEGIEGIRLDWVTYRTMEENLCFVFVSYRTVRRKDGHFYREEGEGTVLVR
jgi:hypothetical protein